jgi:outer membrane lipoprotein-sorting protein
MKTAYLKPAAALGLVLIWLLLLGCGEARAPFAGTYQSVEPYAGKGHIELALKENGEGAWTHEGKSVKFKWRVEDKRIWIYTKEGGIIIVTPTEEGKYLSADMSGEWHPGCPPDKCLNFKRVKAGG